VKIQRLLIALTVINLGILLFQLTQTQRVEAVTPASGEPGTSVLRGSALEIVDDQGRVRASIKLQAGDPKYKWPDGKTGYPETVMFRLIDGKGRPEVKMGASEEGGGVSFLGDNDNTVVMLKSEGADSLIKLTNKAGKQQLIKP
jgi:hypothetical protein